MMFEYIAIQRLEQNWASCVKDLLSRLGFMVVWESQGVGNIETILSVCKQRVALKIRKCSKSKMLYHSCKFQYQKYMDVLIAKYGKSLSCLRLSSHRFEVEVGRWAKPNKVPYENRKCKICNILEDEFHFLLECPLYAELRKRYINKYYWRRSNMPKFIQLLCTEHCKTLKNLGVFIEKAFQLRKEAVLL